MRNNTTNQAKNSVEPGRPMMLGLMQKGRVTAEDISTLRRTILSDRCLSRIEIEDMFALDAVLRPTLHAWTEFFVDAVTDHLIWDLRPTGVLEESQARWLIEKVDASQTASSFAILVSILDEAHQVPQWFQKAVRQRAVASWPSLMSSIEASDNALGH